MQTQQTYKIVFVRHGESTWNFDNRFTGWVDVGLTEKGVNEAKSAGQILAKEGYQFDTVFTSYLKRSIVTFNLMAEEMNQHHVEIRKSWRLNERHYGALQGLNKAETAAKHGEQQVLIWRRSYDIPPPHLDETSEYFPGNDLKYKNVPKDILPRGESLKDTVARVLPYWVDEICPAILNNKKVLVSAHGNSLRAIIQYLDKMSEKDILELNVPTGVPLVYELDANLRPIKHYYLANEEDLKAKIEAVQNQGKAK